MSSKTPIPHLKPAYCGERAPCFFEESLVSFLILALPEIEIGEGFSFCCAMETSLELGRGSHFTFLLGWNENIRVDLGQLTLPV